MPDVTTVVVSAVIGAIVSYALAVIQNILDVRTKIDERLRDERFSVYKVLWKKTELLPHPVSLIVQEPNLVFESPQEN